ncbi:uncharacterized protein [Hetaerina americana]|uniref:uncharacterized protein n=1 Tax=Hetaerina americana TaxID=62018 RepID=UPI003A7F1B39
MPGDITRYEIHHILVRRRYKNQVKQCKSYFGSDINSDHNLVIMESQLRYKKFKRTLQELRWGSKLLVEKDNIERFVTDIEGNLGDEGERSTEERWGELKRAIAKVAEEQLVGKGDDPKKPWITTVIRDKRTNSRKKKIPEHQ